MNTDRGDVAVVEEELDPSVPALVHRAWTADMPWLVQGTSTRGTSDDPADLGLFTGASQEHVVRRRWDVVMSALDVDRTVIAQQVHGAEVRLHREVPAGLHVSDPCDGHVTEEPGVLLSATVADCVPVFLTAPAARAVAVLHAGWRGAAAGVLTRGLSLLAEGLGAMGSGVLVHLGPSICGACYEVGPEVFSSLGLPAPDAPAPLDLRRALARQAVDAGVPLRNITISAHCTRCTGSGLFSHRGGDGGRQVGYIGIRRDAGGGE